MKALVSRLMNHQSLILAVAVAAFLAACGGSTDTTTGTTSAATGAGGGATGSGAGAGGRDCSGFGMMAGVGGMTMGSSMGPGAPDFSCITANCATECKDLPMMGTGPGPGAGGSGGAPTLPGGDIYAAKSCNGCHGDLGAGNQGPNVTPSTIGGIGGWTTQELTAAIRDGKKKDGTNLCASMPRWTATQLSDADLASIVGFMQALPPVDMPNPGTLCGGGGNGASAGSGGVPMITISKECFTCLDAKCAEIANVLHCFTGQ